MPTDLNSYDSNIQTKVTNEFIKRSGGSNGSKNDLNKARSFLNSNPDKVAEIVKTLGLDKDITSGDSDHNSNQGGNRKLGVIEKIMNDL